MIKRLMFALTAGAMICAMPVASATDATGHKLELLAADVGKISKSLAEHDAQAKQDTLTAPCSVGSEKRTSELCAQWKAADAAAQSARWADYTFYLAIAGMFVGLITLFAACIAACSSRVSAREARRSADLAFNTLKNEYRPHIVPSLEFVRDIDVGATLHSTVKVTCKNIGKSVARSLHVVVYPVTLKGLEGAWETATDRFNESIRNGNSPDGKSSFSNSRLSYFSWPSLPHEFEHNITIHPDDLARYKGDEHSFSLNIFVGAWYKGDFNDDYTSSIIFEVRQQSSIAIIPSSISCSTPTPANDIVLRQFPNAVIT